MKKILFLVLAIVFLGIGFATKTHAGTCTYSGGTDCVPLKGYAWGADNKPQTSGIGWINFNNTTTGSNTSSGVDYFVEFDRTTQTLHGYAWSANFGYIKFGGFTEGANKYPVSATCESGTNTDSSCNAKLIKDGAGYKLVGYARFCFVYVAGCSGTIKSTNLLGSMDGWIGFNGTNFSVSYSTSTNNFANYAWASGHSLITNTNYGKGAGWIKMNPTNGGVSCVVVSGADCISDNQKPIVTLSATANPTKYNQDVTISWTITNIPSGCTASLSSTPTNTTWSSTAISSTAGNLASGSKNIGTITTPTTFTLGCTYGSNTGTDDVLVDILSYTPLVTISAPINVNYGTSTNVAYSVTNIPFGCSGALYQNRAIVPGYGSISINGDGTTTRIINGSINFSGLVDTSDWEFKCTDSTAPSPSRVGSDTAKTTVTVPNPTVTFTVKDRTTNSTSLIPCTNTGVEINYSTKDVKPGSCKALLNDVETFSDWGSSTTITENDSPTVHTVNTGQISPVGNVEFTLFCRKLDNTGWVVGRQLNHSCTAGSLNVTSQATCVTPSDTVEIRYTGSNLTPNSCERSWAGSAKINSGNFDTWYTRPASTLTVGQQYTYTVSNCTEPAFPNSTPLSSSVTIDVQNNCGSTTTGSTGCVSGSSFRCKPGQGPTFKEQ
jgi:hypothetical protein